MLVPCSGSYDTILWIDERSKDYLVIGEDLAYFKKGDNSWKKISDQLSGSQKGMVFKDHKLYALTEEELRIFDFSGEFPLQVSRVNVGGCVKLEIKKIGGMRSPAPWEFYKLRRRSNVVLTLGGDVLIVRSKSPCMSCSWNFRIFKMDSSNGNIKWKEIFSLGDEAIILDLGITVLAKDQEGITSNSIYFTAHEMDWFDTDIFVFNLDTNKVEQLPQLVSSVSFTEARWFLPSFRNG
ncbi:F-box protein At1g69090-like [Brassica napus]|uniref:F-box protein At1g69090-like n=1 Tax=Brassica napus TaxID=3708 RepID=UPI00207AEEFE|nr:F-box protein At1g69090-like [Brassica napus]